MGRVVGWAAGSDVYWQGKLGREGEGRWGGSYCAHLENNPLIRCH